MLGYTERDRVVIPVPLYHCFGMVLGNLAATSHGACMVYPAETFDPEATLEACARERCTSLYGVPTMFIAELAHARFAEFDLASLRTGIMAGSPCPIEVMKRVTLGDGYRRDEHRVRDDRDLAGHDPGAPRRHAREPLRHRRRGRARTSRSRSSTRSTGRTVTRGEPGEFLARGYVVMRGYWNDPERTAESIDVQRWMHTGDLATMDEQGYVRIVGRIKDMVIRGGENVYPREIEEFLYSHPEIADVQVIGVPDERYGEELMAWVIPRAGATVTEDEIREFCKGQIAHYKIPRYVKLVDSFPMTVTGKVQKFKMREVAIDELGLAEAAAITHRVATQRHGAVREGAPPPASLPRRPRAARRRPHRPRCGPSRASSEMQLADSLEDVVRRPPAAAPASGARRPRTGTGRRTARSPSGTAGASSCAPGGSRGSPPGPRARPTRARSARSPAAPDPRSARSASGPLAVHDHRPTATQDRRGRDERLLVLVAAADREHAAVKKIHPGTPLNSCDLPMNWTRRRMNAPVKKWSMNEPWFGARITGPFGTFSLAIPRAR